MKEITFDDARHAITAFMSTFLQAYIGNSDIEKHYPELKGVLGTIAVLELAQLKYPEMALFDPDMFVVELARMGYVIRESCNL